MIKNSIPKPDIIYFIPSHWISQVTYLIDKHSIPDEKSVFLAGRVFAISVI